MRHFFKLLFISGMTLGMAVTSLAAVKLPAPSWVSWSSSPPGQATWELVSGAESQYKVAYYKDGAAFKTTHWRENLEGKEDFQYNIYESGSYTFKVQAIGDRLSQIENSDYSELSDVYNYKKPDISFGLVKNVRWSTEQSGVAMWEEPDSMHGKESYLSYRIVLYENNSEIYRIWDVEDTELDLSDMLTDESTYYFSVQALSKNIEEISHGREVKSGNYIDVPAQNDDLEQDLDDLLNLASPSDALQQLEQNWDINKIAVGMQSNDSILDKIAQLERNYLNEIGGNVGCTVESGVNMSADDITLVGAGLNMRDNSDSMTFRVKKPSNEANVDPDLYKNYYQVDLSLSGATGKLKIPITITLPVPANINPDRLVILHYKSNGTYEVLNLNIAGDGQTATFTITSFSIFAFAEQVEDTGNGGGDSDDGNTDDDNSNGGGSGDGNSGGGNSGGGGSGGSSSGGGSGSGSGGGSRVHIDANRTPNTPGSWVISENGWQFKNVDGSLVTNNWVISDNMWYFMNQDGLMSTKWIFWNNNWYYLSPVKESVGKMSTGWLYDQDNQKWFYLASDGRCLEGWQQVDSKWYYLNPSDEGTKGALAVNTSIDGFVVGADGSWTE